MSSHGASYGDGDDATQPDTQPEVPDMTALLEWTEAVSRQEISAEDWEAMDEELCRRVEINDGRILPMPAANPRHSLMVGLMWRTLLEQAPDEFDVAMETDVRLRDAPLLQRKPDVVVMRSGRLDVNSWVPAQDVVLLVEVESPGSMTQDRYDKPAQYAGAKIPHYWRVERGPDAKLYTYTYDVVTDTYPKPMMHDIRYRAKDPFEIDIDVQALLNRR
jgi:Uma2 family endonuclease